jgi:drug/metabolite transporter (DMT)-like permease
LQYGLLRLYVPKMGGWILATLAGSLLVFVTMTLLTRVFETAFLNLWNGALAFATIGGLIGLSQWILLRRRISKAGWWILASILGWGLAVLGSLTEVRNGSALAQILTFSLSPAIVAGFAWWYLLRPESQRENYLSG